VVKNDLDPVAEDPFECEHEPRPEREKHKHDATHAVSLACASDVNEPKHQRRVPSDGPIAANRKAG
jgi:hypothetical protein